MDKKRVYLDYAATTPISQEALLTFEKTSKEILGNSSSVHSFGREALKVVDRAREVVGKSFGANYNEIIFTSGATEANNLAIFGLVKKFKEKRPDLKPHIITSNVEHPSVLEVCKYLESSSQASVTFISVNSDGVIDFEKVKEAIKPETILISIMWVNNETGAVMPIRKIGKIVLKENEKREKEIWVHRANGGKDLSYNSFEKIYFHTDASQALITQEIDVVDSYLDLMTVSGHKIYGPKGIGCLYVKSGVPIANIVFGGDQELSLRPGTLPVATVSSFAAAIEYIFNIKKELQNTFSTLNLKVREMMKDIPNLVMNSNLEGSAHILNFSIKGIKGEMLLLKLDNQGFGVSTGSACSAGGVSASHVISSMTQDQDVVEGAIRISFGKDTQIEDIEKFVETLKRLI